MKFFCGYKRCYHRTSFASLYELIEHLRAKSIYGRSITQIRANSAPSQKS